MKTTTQQEAGGQGAKLETLSTLAGGIAQDFNNLLVGILAHTGLALKALAVPHGGGQRTARENIEQVESAALRAAELVRKLLAFSGKAKLTAQSLDLASLLHEMRPLLRSAVPRPVELELNLTSQLPLIEGDAAQIRQLMQHLLTNAADAIGERPGRVSVGTGIVELEDDEGERYLPEALPPGRYIYVTVTDDGCGMDEATAQKIFDPFFTTKSSGQGLGLAAVLGIMHGHRGALKVESEPDAGTTVQVFFPCSPKKTPAYAPGLPYTPPKVPTIATILVADDDDTVRKVTEKILETAGYTVVTAADGVEAVERLREHGQEIALALLDMRMPRMGGAEAFQEMRRLNPRLPIILSSGYDPQEGAANLVADGPAVFLHKPYAPQDLTAKVNLLLDTSSGR